MKTALILHSTDATPHSSWFDWLRSELTGDGYTVRVPALPNAHTPNIASYNEVIMSADHDDSGRPMGWEFNDDTLIVGHSSGAVAILGLLEALPDDTRVGTCILVASFMNDLGWENLRELFMKPFDFERIRTKARKFIFVHSDNDPYCPLEQAEYLCEKVGGELVIIPGQGHFSAEASPEYVRFPALLDIIQGDLLNNE